MNPKAILMVIACAVCTCLAGCGNSPAAKDARAQILADAEQAGEEMFTNAAKCVLADVTHDQTLSVAHAESVATSCGLTVLFETAADAVKVAWKWITDAIAQKKAATASQAPPEPAAGADTQKGSSP